MPSRPDSLEGRRGFKEPVDRVRELEEQLLKVLPVVNMCCCNMAPTLHRLTCSVSLLCPCSQGDIWSNALL